MEFRAETFGKDFWHRAKTFGTKLYFGTQMNRPKVSNKKTETATQYELRQSEKIKITQYWKN